MKKKILTILLLAMLAFIWGNSLLSREASAALSDGLMQRMNAVAEALGLGEGFFTYMYDQDGDGVAEPTSHIVRKLAHVTEFAVFAALLWLRLESRDPRRALTALLLSAGVGAADETLQIFSHRGSAVSDVLIDALGAAVGISLALLLSAWARRRRENSGRK